MPRRKPNGASTVYLGSDGSWHGRVTVGVRDDGSPDRRHVRGKTQTAVLSKVRVLEKARDEGQTAKPGARFTVAQWLEHWLDNVARPSLRLRSYEAYQVAVTKHLIPGIGKHRLDRLEPEHLEVLYRTMITNGAKAATAHQVHRTLRTALGEALRRGHVARNVATVARAPRVRVGQSSRSPSRRCVPSSPPVRMTRTGRGGRSRFLWGSVRVRHWVCNGRMSTLNVGSCRYVGPAQDLGTSTGVRRSVAGRRAGVRSTFSRIRISVRRSRTPAGALSVCPRSS